MVKVKVKVRVKAKVRARAMEAKEAASVFHMDYDPCVLIWFYGLSQLATVRLVVKSTIAPTINKEVDTVVPKVCLSSIV